MIIEVVIGEGSVVVFQKEVDTDDLILQKKYKDLKLKYNIYFFNIFILFIELIINLSIDKFKSLIEYITVF